MVEIRGKKLRGRQYPWGIVEVENPGSPFGIRGVGEVPLAPPLAAIQDAIYNAVNVRLFDTPMNPARIVNALMNGH